MAVEDDAIAESALQLLPEPIAQRAHSVHRREIARKLARLAEADGKQRAFGARAPAALVPGTVDQRLERRSRADVQRADTLWRIELVAGDREQIHAESFTSVGILPTDWAASV